MARQPIKAASPLWQISLSIARESEEAAVALLERIFGKAATVFSPESENVSVVTVYSSGNSQRVRRMRNTLTQGVRLLADCDLDLGNPRIIIRRVPREDWSTSWKKFFRTIEIGKALLIKPSWSRDRAKPGQASVTLDPGLSFGTGQHPTTSFCLRQIVGSRETGTAQSFLDIGTGSGILAIAAVKLGFAPVRAFDNDAVAVRVAKANAAKNRVDHKLVITRQDLTKAALAPKHPSDLVCANLVHDLLLAELPRIRNRVRPGGRLVLAGLLTDQFEEVQRTYERAGFNTQIVRTQGEWTSGAFLRLG